MLDDWRSPVNGHHGATWASRRDMGITARHRHHCA